ncbi:phosphotransferase [Knoellia sp. 3-2P3]|uniref:phosphotransferase family protein n=1 Tax=unclassified Knoellia TaxID=2618719 RepID=UPI0023DB7A2C|nr:phosphotransferase [Knoellia sp. 3-2P3]MDF2092458.1 phosphotransferase [Knoellia sp. 3-2P3]
MGPLADRGLAPRLLHAEESANLLVTGHLEGQLVLGTAAEGESATYAQAGGLLALLHGQASRTDPDFEREQNARTLRWLEGPHRIDADTAAEIRARVATFDCPPALLVPTHGDWQPRNWLAHGGCIRAIDFGRADWRPAFSDLARLAVQQFADRPDLEAAFLAGYGTDPRDPDAWRSNQLREAVGTACWANQVGDTSFETQGHRMIADALRAG